MEPVEEKQLINKLLEKSKQGKIDWQATSEEQTFIASVGNNSFKISLFQPTDRWGQSEGDLSPVLMMLDQTGKSVWRVEGRGLDVVNDPLTELYKIAQRIGDRVDERLASALESLDALD
jgi:hypothetical protein